MTESHFVEGYWERAGRAITNTFMPEPREQPVDAAFLDKLGTLELYARGVTYLGYSKCRVCDCDNGCAERTIRHGGITYTFPQGLRHYYEAHNVHPSDKFRDFVMEYTPPTADEFMADLESTDILNILGKCRAAPLFPKPIADRLQAPGYAKRLRDLHIARSFEQLLSGMAVLKYSD